MQASLCYCLFAGVSSLFLVTSAVLNNCANPESEVLNCVVGELKADPCRISAQKNRPLISLHNKSGQNVQPFYTGNVDEMEVYITVYDKKAHSWIGANVSLVVKSKQTVGVWMCFRVNSTARQKNEPFERCRYVDTSNVTNNFQHSQSLNMWYDCMYFEKGEKQFTFNLREFPSEIQRNKTCAIPDLDNLNPVTILEWKPLICVELLSIEKIFVWFQTAPAKFENLSYHVSLYKDGGILENSTVFTNTSDGSPAKKIEFDNLPPGNYFVGLTALQPGCPTTLSPNFVIPVPERLQGANSISTFHLCLLLGVFLLLACLVGIFVRNLKKPLSLNASVYLVYVYDTESHFNLVKQFGYLLKTLGIKVRLDDWEIITEDPRKWAYECVVQADFVILVWSEAAIRRYRNAAYECDNINEPQHLTSHLFNPILKYVNDRINNSKFTNTRHSVDSVCNICWDSSIKRRIPDEFKYLLPFIMPRKLSKLLVYLQDTSVARNLPCEPCLLRTNLKQCKEYVTFLKLLQTQKSETMHSENKSNDHGDNLEVIIQPPTSHKDSEMPLIRHLPTKLSTDVDDDDVNSVKDQEYANSLIASSF